MDICLNFFSGVLRLKARSNSSSSTTSMSSSYCSLASATMRRLCASSILKTAWSPSIAAKSRAARALRTAFEALVFGDFIMAVSRQPLALALGAELCCRAIGATAGRLSAYLLERCGSEAAQYARTLCTAAAAWLWVCLRFFVSKASEAAQGGVRGLLSCLRWRSTFLRECSQLVKV